MRADGTFEPLEKRRVYSLTTTSYLMGGGAGYGMIAGNSQSSIDCQQTTMMEATQEYMLREKVYTPSLPGLVSYNHGGVAMPMRNQSFGNCSKYEKHDAYWQDCFACETGFWRPDLTSNVCVEKTSEGVNVFMVVGIVLGVVVLLAVPLAWKMTEKQRRINALFNNNKVAEECAVAVMDLRLSDLDYLNDLPSPNTIQAAFIAIARQMKMYMEFMPKNLIANYQPSDEDDSTAVDKQSDVRSNSGHSKQSPSFSQSSAPSRVSHRAAANAAVNAGAVKSNYARKKRISVLALNSRSHTAKCAPLDSDGVRALHSRLIESFNSIVESSKGLAESMCGDRLLAAWNTVVYRSSHCTLACKAAATLSSLQKEEGEGGIVRHLGLSSGTALFGLFGGAGTRKYDIVGKVVPAAMLLALLNKEYDTQCLFPHPMLHEVSTSFYMRIVDYVNHPKLTDGCFVYALAETKGDVATEEWMYELETAENTDPYKTHNSHWTDFIKTGQIAADITSLNGKLLQLKNDAVSGQYCSTCPGLSLY